MDSMDRMDQASNDKGFDGPHGKKKLDRMDQTKTNRKDNLSCQGYKKRNTIKTMTRTTWSKDNPQMRIKKDRIMNSETQAIETAIDNLKGETTDKLKQRLFECSAEVVALNHLLFNKSQWDLPYPMSSEQAQEYRNRVKHFIDGRLPVARQVLELRQKQEQIKKGNEL